MIGLPGEKAFFEKVMKSSFTINPDALTLKPQPLKWEPVEGRKRVLTDGTTTVELVEAGVDYQMRETFESAMQFGVAALRELGVSEDEAREISDEVRRRDEERFELEMAGGTDAARALLRGNLWKPTPLVAPRRAGKPLGSEPSAPGGERALD